MPRRSYSRRPRSGSGSRSKSVRSKTHSVPRSKSRQSRSMSHARKSSVKKEHRGRSHSVKKMGKTKREQSTGGRGGDIDKLRTKPKGIPQKPWKEMTAMTKQDRAKMPKSCFLLPEERKYPICYKNSVNASCVGLQAAKRRANMQGNTYVAKKAEQLELEHGCNERGGPWEYREQAIYEHAKSKGK